MSGNHTVVMGNRGRLVVPAVVRARHGLGDGSSLTLIDTGFGLVLLTREQLHARVAAQLEGSDLVGELVAERRRGAAEENSDPVRNGRTNEKRGDRGTAT